MTLAYKSQTFVKETQILNQQNFKPGKSVNVKKTDVKNAGRDFKTANKRCPIHITVHTLNECKAFRKKSVCDRNLFLREQNRCYRCCGSDTITSKNCRADIRCENCGSSQHPTAVNPLQSLKQNVGECTVCGGQFTGCLCAKAVLVDIIISEINPFTSSTHLCSD